MKYMIVHNMPVVLCQYGYIILPSTWHGGSVLVVASLAFAGEEIK